MGRFEHSTLMLDEKSLFIVSTLNDPKGIHGVEVSSSTANLLIYYGPRFVEGAQLCWNRKGHRQTVPTKLGV